MEYPAFCNKGCCEVGHFQHAYCGCCECVAYYNFLKTPAGIIENERIEAIVEAEYLKRQDAIIARNDHIDRRGTTYNALTGSFDSSYPD